MNRKWLYVIIAGLVIACLLLVGYVVGQKLGRGSHFSDRSMFYVFERMVEPLPEARRKEISEAIEQDQKRLRMALRSLNRIRKQVHEQTLAPEFDAEVVSESLAEMRTQLQTVKAIQDERWLTIMQQLTMEERQLLLRHRGGRHEGRNGNTTIWKGPDKPRDQRDRSTSRSIPDINETED